jgi:hypothetical protein
MIQNRHIESASPSFSYLSFSVTCNINVFPTGAFAHNFILLVLVPILLALPDLIGEPEPRSILIPALASLRVFKATHVYT